MPRPRPQYLQRRIMRNGEAGWYVRLGRGPLIRIRGAYGSPEFNAAYQAAIAGEKPPPKGAPAKDTIGWLLALYRSSVDWDALAPSTRRQRDGIYSKMPAANLLHTVDRTSIEDGLKRRKKTPAQARHFLDAIRALFVWGLKNGLVKVNPTDGVATPKQRPGGIPVWSEDDLAKYEARWPRGTRERVMFDVFVYTGLRIGDAAELGKQHVRNGIIAIDTQKSGKRVRVTLPVLPPLAKTLKAGPLGELVFIADKHGKPLLKNSLGNAFAKACREAGIRKSAHGIRKAAATRAANNGATVAELEALFGWTGGTMASHYTKSADRKLLAARSANLMLPHADIEVASASKRKR